MNPTIKDHAHQVARDTQIDMMREIEIKINAAKKLLADVSKGLSGMYNNEHTDIDIKATLGGMFDGAAFANQTLTETLHDACVGFYKTSDDTLSDAIDADEEFTHKSSVRSIYNENKL